MNSAEPPPVWSRSLNKPLDPAVPGKAVAELSAVTDTSWLLLKIPEPENNLARSCHVVRDDEVLHPCVRQVRESHGPSTVLRSYLYVAVERRIGSEVDRATLQEVVGSDDDVGCC